MVLTCFYCLGHQRCNNLQGEVEALKVAEILEAGLAVAHVPSLDWEDLRGEKRPAVSNTHEEFYMQHCKRDIACARFVTFFWGFQS